MKNFFTGAITALLLGVVVVLGLSLSGLIPIAATSKEPAPLAWLLHTTYEKSVQRSAANITVPSDINSEQRVLKGAKNFAAMCAGCHTAPGKQATAASLGLNPPPPKAVELGAKLTAAERFWVISNGVKMTGMPAFGPSHSDKDELWALVAFTGKLPNIDAASYEKLVTKARAQMPAGDGHNHSHASDSEAGKGQMESGHSSGSHESTNKPGHHESAASNKVTHSANDSTNHHDEAPEPEPEVKAAAKPPEAGDHGHSGHSH